MWTDIYICLHRDPHTYTGMNINGHTDAKVHTDLCVAM